MFRELSLCCSGRWAWWETCGAEGSGLSYAGSHTSVVVQRGTREGGEVGAREKEGEKDGRASRAGRDRATGAPDGHAALPGIEMSMGDARCDGLVWVRELTLGCRAVAVSIALVVDGSARLIAVM